MFVCILYVSVFCAPGYIQVTWKKKSRTNYLLLTTFFKEVWVIGTTSKGIYTPLYNVLY